MAKSTSASRKLRPNGFDPNDVQDRYQLGQYLSLSTSDEFRGINAAGEVVQKSTFIKTYLVECHGNGSGPSAAQWKRHFRSSTQLRDTSLVRLNGDRGTVFFADVLDPRFVLLHSIDRTEETDRQIERLTSTRAGGFDRSWIPKEFLFGMRGSRLRGFKLSHLSVLGGVRPEFDSNLTQPMWRELNPEKLDSTTNEGPAFQDSVESDTSNQVSRLSVANTASAENDYQRIVDANVFDGRRSLDAIEFRTFNGSDSLNTDLYSNGKMVGQGNSQDLHLLVSNRIRNSYGRAIKEIENTFSIGWTQGEQTSRLRGEILSVEFPQGSVIDLQQFVQTLFSSRAPFNMYGISHNASNSRIDVEAIDLHTLDPISFEVTADWMRVYLPLGSCANILARLVSNLQRSLHSEVKLTTAEGVQLFSTEDGHAH